MYLGYILYRTKSLQNFADKSTLFKVTDVRNVQILT